MQIKGTTQKFFNPLRGKIATIKREKTLKEERARGGLDGCQKEENSKLKQVNNCFNAAVLLLFIYLLQIITNFRCNG